MKRISFSFLMVFLAYRFIFFLGANNLPEGGGRHYILNNFFVWFFSTPDSFYLFLFFCFIYLFSFFWVRKLNNIGLFVWSVFVGCYLPYVVYPFDNGSKIGDVVESFFGGWSWGVSVLLPLLLLFLFFCFPAFVGSLLKK